MFTFLLSLRFTQQRSYRPAPLLVALPYPEQAFANMSVLCDSSSKNRRTIPRSTRCGSQRRSKSRSPRTSQQSAFHSELCALRRRIQIRFGRLEAFAGDHIKEPDERRAESDLASPVKTIRLNV
jgi:hypothetical protein